MNGHNELHLCTAEMIVAMQEYMDKRMLAYAPKVVDVRANNDGGAQTFVISLAAEKEPTDAR